MDTDQASALRTELQDLWHYLTEQEQSEIDELLNCSLLEPTKGEMEGSFRTFLQHAWKIIEPERPFRDTWHIGVTCEYIEAVTQGQIRKLVINLPPRHTKSTIVAVMWPAWVWTTNPSRRWIFGSYAQNRSVADSVKCRRLITSSWYLNRWREVFMLTGDQNQKMRFENSRGGIRIATSTGSGIMGEGGDFIVGDDVMDREQAHSETYRETALDWWDHTMSTRTNDPKTAAFVVIMQRLHEADLTGHLLREGGWEHLCLEAEREPNRKATSIPRYVDPRRAGELLCPDRFGSQEAEDAKKKGAYFWNSQYQQRPAPEEGGICKRGWWRFHNGDLPMQFDAMIQSWDMTYTDTDTAAFVVGCVIGKKDANYYFLDLIRRRMDIVDTMDAMKDLRKRWPSTESTLVESAANGTAIIRLLRDKISGLIPINADKSKIARARAVIGMIESGNVYLPHEAPWTSDFIDEWATLPNNQFWDQVDASDQGLNWLRTKCGGSWF